MLKWTDRSYENNLDHGVFYPQYGPGEVWNGLVSVNETPSDMNEETRYIDGVKTRRRRFGESFSGTIEAFTYPDSFYTDFLTHRPFKSFGMSYLVNDKLHLVYNVLLNPSKMGHRYSESEPYSWGFTTIPVSVPYSKASAHVVIDKQKAYQTTVGSLEEIIYGSVPRLPLPSEVFDIFEVNSIVRVIDNGDGTFTVNGPDDVVRLLDATTFEIGWSSAYYVDGNTYRISSL